MVKAITFSKTKIQIKKLITSDQYLAALIERVGRYKLCLQTDYFVSLTETIISQQLSAKAARTIWARICTICGDITPHTILSTNDDILRGTGISRAKVSYIKDLSEKILAEKIDFKELASFSDEKAIDTLVQIKGIGKWSAEMFLIFSVGRENILSLEDAGLRRAIKWLYNFSEMPQKEDVQKLGQKWEPYRTVASLYLWEAINRDYICEPPPASVNQTAPRVPPKNKKAAVPCGKS